MKLEIPTAFLVFECTRTDGKRQLVAAVDERAALQLLNDADHYSGESWDEVRPCVTAPPKEDR